MRNAPLTSTVSDLSDRQLLEQIKKMVDREQRLTLIIVDHLCEIEARSRKNISSTLSRVAAFAR